MRILVCYLFIFCCVCSSCKRRSGRRTASEQRLNTTKSTQVDSRTKKIVVPTSSNSSRPKKQMSGSEIFEKYNTAVFTVYTSNGLSGFQGSGFFISSTGVAVSNYHVFQGTTRGLEVIKLSNGNTYNVSEVIGFNEDNDYIVFRTNIGKDNVNYIPVSSLKPKVGERAFAIGSPRGLENTFSSGEISQIRDENVIQISVPIDHGSSGGALINSYGEVIGITSAGLDYSGANLNFAMSINVIPKIRKLFPCRFYLFILDEIA